jgi:hypothetical protein
VNQEWLDKAWALNLLDPMSVLGADGIARGELYASMRLRLVMIPGSPFSHVGELAGHQDGPKKDTPG